MIHKEKERDGCVELNVDQAAGETYPTLPFINARIAPDGRLKRFDVMVTPSEDLVRLHRLSEVVALGEFCDAIILAAQEQKQEAEAATE